VTRKDAKSSKNPGVFHRAIFLSLAILSFCCPAALAQEYGQRLADDGQVTVWWAPGAYKVMKDDPPPRASSVGVRIACARNEHEPFILVLRPKQPLENIRVEIDGLHSSTDTTIPPSRISICHVGYVRVTVPTDEAGKAGEWPDPLPPYEGPFSAEPGKNTALWITLFVPPEVPAGRYEGMMIISSPRWTNKIPVYLRVWDFVLPRTASLRSSFGLFSDDIKRYHNLETREEIEKVTDLYYQNLRDHRVAPTSPLALYPMKVEIKGVCWKGGEFVSDAVHSGGRALRIDDTSVSENAEATPAERLVVEPDTPYLLRWYARTEKENQRYTVLLQGHDDQGQILPALNLLSLYEGSPNWKAESLEVKKWPPEVKSVSLHLFPTFRDQAGSLMGTATFDDIFFGRTGESANLLSGGDMEMAVDDMEVTVDFSEFDRAARRYLDEFGFNAFNLHLEGLGGGSFFSQRRGIFGGFPQGSPEYDRLLSQYLGIVESHLAEKGWLGKEYIYWFDEPDPDDYPFVREGMTTIRRAAPRLTRFITEHRPGPDIMDVSEISCTIFHRVNPAAVAELSSRGREFWSYLCTGPKAPWVTLFIDHPAVNLRLWPWMSYRFGLKGILVWRANYWNSPTVFPREMVQNPWEDPMSYTVGYGTPYGQVNDWGNGDGRFLYPPNRDPNGEKNKYLSGPINSVRWEILREGIEDYEYFRLLEEAVRKAPPDKKELAEKGRSLLRIPESVFTSGREYTKDPKVIFEYRQRLAELLETLLEVRPKSTAFPE
jgi:hypothetical protein